MIKQIWAGWAWFGPGNNLQFEPEEKLGHSTE